MLGELYENKEKQIILLVDLTKEEREAVLWVGMKKVAEKEAETHKELQVWLRDYGEALGVTDTKKVSQGELIEKVREGLKS